MTTSLSSPVIDQLPACHPMSTTTRWMYGTVVMPEAALPTWPPTEGLSTVNVLRQDTILTMYASTRISAPASQVLHAVRDLSKYSEWNRFCPKAKVDVQPTNGGEESPAFDTLQVGTVFTFQVVMNEKRPDGYTPTQLKVTDISTPEHPSAYVPADILLSEPSFTNDLHKVYRISWKTEGGFVAKGLRGERFHEIIILNEQECQVRTWECQGGVLANAVKWMYKKTLMEKFQMWCDDLKAYCERETTTG